MLINLSVNITYRCNTTCHNCNRGIGRVDWSDVPDMTPDDARERVAAIKESGIKIKKLRLAGGEPSIHPNLGELAEIFRPVAGKVHIAVNGIIPPEDLPPLPSGAFYKVSGFDSKDHHTVFASPHDLGLEGRMKPLSECVSMNLVGRGTENEGFTQCALARTIWRALGRDEQEIMYPQPVLEPDEKICKHCPLSLGTRQNKKLTWHVLAGNYEVPTKSFVGLTKKSKMMHAADGHVRRAEEQGAVSVIGNNGLLPIIERPPGEWAEPFEHDKDD